MPVTDAQMELLRAHIAGRQDAVRSTRSQLTSVEGLAALVEAAFITAVRIRFSPSWTRAEVIRFVGRVRTLLADRPGLVDAVAAEREIRRALGEKLPGGRDVPAAATAQLLILDVLVEDLNLDDAGVASLLSQARGAADRTLAAAGF